jgi:hypothetical protein
MKRITFIIALAVASFTFKAQQAGTWQNAILRSDGRVQMDGVQAFCQKTTCNGEDVVLVKFVNNNNYKVRITWVDAIWVKGVWYYPKNNAEKVMVLDANSNTVGQCGGEEKLSVKITGIIENPADFGHYTVSGLAINK